MKQVQSFLVIGVIAFAALISHSQDDKRVREGAEVKTAVSRLDIKKRPRVDMILRDLATLRGVIVGTGDDDLSVSVKVGKEQQDLSIPMRMCLR